MKSPTTFASVINAKMVDYVNQRKNQTEVTSAPVPTDTTATTARSTSTNVSIIHVQMVPNVSTNQMTLNAFVNPDSLEKPVKLVRPD